MIRKTLLLLLGMSFSCNSMLIEDTLNETLNKGSKIIIKKESNNYAMQIHSNDELFLETTFEGTGNSGPRDFFKRMQKSAFKEEEQKYTVALYSLPNENLQNCIIKDLKESNLDSFLKEGNNLIVKKEEDFIKISYFDKDEMWAKKNEIVFSTSFLEASKLMSSKLKESL